MAAKQPKSRIPAMGAVDASGLPVPEALPEALMDNTEDMTDSASDDFSEEVEEIEEVEEEIESEVAVATPPPPPDSDHEPLDDSFFFSTGEEPTDEERARRKKLRGKRLNVAKELLSTEETYVQNLDNLMKVFYDPMNANSRKKEAERLLTQDDVKQIFGNLKVILGYNRMLLGDLKSRIEVPSQQKIEVGAVFVQMAVFLKSYTAYCNDYERALETLRRLNENKAFEKFFLSIHNKEIIKDSSIKQFLILPVQRIPRYKMLLEEMRKATWESHPDYESLCTALDQIRKIAQFVEDAQEKFVNMNKIIEIQNKLRFSRKFAQRKLLEADRVLIHQAAIKTQEGTPGGEGLRKREIILFNDILLVTKKVVEKDKQADKSSKKAQTKTTYKLRKFIELASCLGVAPGVIEGLPGVTLMRNDVQLTFGFEDEAARDKFKKMLENCHKQSMMKNHLRLASGEQPEEPSGLKQSSSSEKVRTPKKRRVKKKSHLSKTATEPDDVVVMLNPLMQMQQKRNRVSAATTPGRLGKNRSNTMQALHPPPVGMGIPSPGGPKSRTAVLCASETTVRKSPSMNAISDKRSPRAGSGLSSAASMSTFKDVEPLTPILRKSSASGPSSARKPSVPTATEAETEGAEEIPAEAAARERLANERRNRLARSPSVGSLSSVQNSERRKKTIPKFL